MISFCHLKGENLQDHCCFCSTLDLINYEYSVISDPSVEAFLIKQDSKDIGYLVFQNHKDISTIHLLCIHKNNQRNKIGEKTMQFFIEYSRKNKIKIIRLVPNDEASKRFYLRFNFIENAAYLDLRLI